MPPRRINDDYMGDSDSDVSILDDEPSNRKSKGKGKAVDRGKGDKGKGKFKEVYLYQWSMLFVLKLVGIATVCMGGLVRTIMGHSTRG